jgi:hypothetical protein
VCSVCVLAGDLPVLAVDGRLAAALGLSRRHLQRSRCADATHLQHISTGPHVHLKDHCACCVWQARPPA